jgi:hypothetical protein
MQATANKNIQALRAKNRSGLQIVCLPYYLPDAYIFLPKADCFSFAGLSPANEKKIYLCDLCAFAVNLIINHPR